MKEFKTYLKNIEYPKNKTSWDIAGNLNNGFYKFDTRPITNNVKISRFDTKADKIVFDVDDKYIVVDTEELITYLKKHNIEDVNLQDLIFNLDWNIVLLKKENNDSRD